VLRLLLLLMVVLAMVELGTVGRVSPSLSPSLPASRFLSDPLLAA
jgi:hypothetical protein